MPVKRRIRLRGVNGDIEGKIWESDSVLRAGRLESLEIVLDDTSVSRRHAEIRASDQGWHGVIIVTLTPKSMTAIARVQAVSSGATTSPG